MSTLPPQSLLHPSRHSSVRVEGSVAQLLPNKNLHSLIKSAGTVGQLKQIHAQIIKTAHFEETHLLTALISASPSFHYARLVFLSIDNPNVFQWTSIVSASSRNGYAAESLVLFRSMRESNTMPNNFTLSSVLSACASVNAIDEGKQVHSLYVRCGFHQDVYIDTALIHLYGKCMQSGNSRQVFDNMPYRNLASVNAMIFSYASNSQMEEAEFLFSSTAEKDSVSYTSMIMGYGDQCDVLRACELFDQMTDRSVGSWNSMISVYSKCGLRMEAASTFCDMLASGLFPSALTISTVLSVCAQQGYSYTGKGLHAYVVKCGLEPDCFLSSALIDMYAKCGYIGSAHTVFLSAHDRNLGTWNSIIFAFGAHGKGEAALAKVLQMEREGIRPNELTLLGILCACNHTGLIQEACACFSTMVEKYKLLPNPEHYACLVDLLGRAGHVKEALDVIRSMPITPDISTWGSLLSACRIHSDLQLGLYASEHIFELDPDHCGGHVLLSNLCSSVGHWNSASAIRLSMKDKGVQKRITGCSWIDVNKSLHRFNAMDTTHPQVEQVYEMLNHLTVQLKMANIFLDKQLGCLVGTD